MNVTHTGNLTFTQIRKVAEGMRERSGAVAFKGTIKEILGTCTSLGCKVEGYSTTTFSHAFGYLADLCESKISCMGHVLFLLAVTNWFVELFLDQSCCRWNKGHSCLS